MGFWLVQISDVDVQCMQMKPILIADLIYCL